MRTTGLVCRAVGLVLATLAVSALGAPAQRVVRRQAVFVVAVKDSAVLTMCPELREATMATGKTWTSDGRVIVSRFTDDLQLLRFPPRESPPDLRADPRLRTELRGTQAILPIARSPTEDSRLQEVAGGIELGREALAMDPTLKQAVERELKSLGTYEIAASLQGADLLFFVEGSYIALAASSTTDTGRSDQALAPLGASAQPGDWQRNVIQSVLAVAAPARVYLARPGDMSALLSARTWEGSEVFQPPYRVRESSRATGVTRVETRWTWESASPEALVWQFVGRKPRPASHPPLCAVSSSTFNVPAVASGGTLVPVVSEGGTRPAASTPQSPGSRVGFQGGVTYVTVPVSVTDREGRTVVDLDPSLFRVYEDETLQVIDRVDRPGGPVNVALLIDTSSSLRRKADEIHAATAAAIDAFGRLGAVVVASFDRRVVWHSTLPDERDRRLPGARSTIGRTATRFYDALDLLLTGPLKAPSARTVLVILTDGVDTASRVADAETARRRLGESHIPVYVIHYDTSQDNAPAPPDGGISLFVNGVRPHLTRRLLPEDAADPGPAYARAATFLRQIVDTSGGRLITAPVEDDVEKTFADIATELSQQYTVAYYPVNQAHDGTFRRIRLEVEGADVSVRARAGYYQATAKDVLRRH